MSNLDRLFGTMGEQEQTQSTQIPVDDGRPAIVLNDQKKPTVEIFGTDLCSWCDKAEALSKSRGLPVKKMVIGVDVDMKTFQMMTNGATTVPQCVINGELIGGYEQLMKYFELVDGGQDY